MARVLQCPNCEARHSLDAVEAGSTFACTGCGRTLRAPQAPAVVDPAGAATAGDAARGAPGARAERRREESSRSNPEPGNAPSGFPRAVRIAAWVVAVVVGGLVSLWLARAIGLLTADNLVDVITGSGNGRYLRLGVFVVLWALVVTGLVTLLIDGGWRLLRRGAATVTAAPAVEANDPVTVPGPTPAARSTPMPPRGTTDQRPRRIPPRDTGV